MTWQFALLFNIIFSSLRGSIYKKLVDKLDPFVIMFHTNVLGIIFFSFYYLLRNHTLPTIYLEMMVLGLVFTIAFGMFLLAVRISFSQSFVFSSYSIIITLFMAAVFLGEWKFFDITNYSGIKNILGIFFAFISLYLLIFKGSKKEQQYETKWLTFMGISIILSGLGSFWSKSFLFLHYPAETLLSQYVGGAPLQILLCKIRKKGFMIPGKSYYLILVCAVLEFFTLNLFYFAYKNGPAVIVLPVQTLALTIFTALIGLVFFKEAHMFKKDKLWGLILGIMGVAILVI